MAEDKSVKECVEKIEALLIKYGCIIDAAAVITNVGVKVDIQVLKRPDEPARTN